MQKDFDNFEQLLKEVKFDRDAVGVNSSIRNRYPVRFVLFDNFKDSKLFVEELIGLGVTKMQKIVDWMDKVFPDQMLTYSDLANKIEQYIFDNDDSCIIVPFSELARYYDNNYIREFDALLSKVKGIQSSSAAFRLRQRIYIPMVGQYAKMSKFFEDSQSIIWHYANKDEETNVHVILSKSMYGVRGLESTFSVIPSITDWLKIWRDDEAKSSIISTSKTLFAFADNALPDNALTYTKCNNAFEFLIKGLHLDFGTIIYKDEDAAYWEQLAKAIDYNNFSLKQFVNQYFDIYNLSDYSIFIKTWFEYNDAFKRWLLTTYYLVKFDNRGYISRVLKECNSYTSQEFVTHAMLAIFDSENFDEDIKERECVIKFAVQNHISLSLQTENILKSKLENVVAEYGYSGALKFMSSLTNVERELIIEWLGTGMINLNQIQTLYPDLFLYLGKSIGITNVNQKWILDYCDLYKRCKVGNNYLDGLKCLIEEKNANPTTFNTWYNSFKTVRSIMDGRSDIEIFYWIDGLGIDWIPYIISLINKNQNSNVFVNEVLVARSILPTKTDVNKVELHKLAGESLSKKGDLDSFAHKCTPYPNYIIEELEIVKNAILDIISEHAGKKIAIISDHGLSYVAQLCPGYNLGNIKSDHHGRIAQRVMGVPPLDNKYVILDDGVTLCALRHNSLCEKIPNGQGCHGGCTPEEALVPIIIVSSEAKSSDYTINLTDNEISGTNPIISLRIKGVTSMDTPKLIYNNIGYNLNDKGDDKFVSERILLQQDIDYIEIRIGDFSKKFKLKINLGAEENDLFDI